MTENLLTTKNVKTIDPKDIDINRLYVLVMFDNNSSSDIVVIGRFMNIPDELMFNILSIKSLSGYGIWERISGYSNSYLYYPSSKKDKKGKLYDEYINIKDHIDNIKQISILYTDIVNNHSNGVDVKLETRTLDDIDQKLQALSIISAKQPHTEDGSNNNNLPWYKKLWKKLTNKKVTTDISRGNSVYVASGSDNVIVSNITQISNNTK